MNWLKLFLNSTLGRKVLVGLSGLALVGFLATHLAGNLLIYKGAHDYDAYAEGLHANPLLLLGAEVILFTFFVVHIVLSIALKARSRAARPVGYDGLKSKRGSPGYAPSKTMIVTGLVVLAFLIVHLMDMKFHVRFGEPGASKAAYTIRVLQDTISAPLYLVGSLLLGYHVNHGFQSAFQSIGANHPKFSPAIKWAGIVFAFVVAIGFASFPIYALLKRG